MERSVKLSEILKKILDFEDDLSDFVEKVEKKPKKHENEKEETE